MPSQVTVRHPSGSSPREGRVWESPGCWEQGNGGVGSVFPYHCFRIHSTCPTPAGTLISAPGLWSQIRAAQISCVWEILKKKNRSGPNDFVSCLIISCSKHPDLGNDIARQSPSNAASLWEQSVKSGLEGLFCGVRSSWLLFWCLPLGLICSPRTDIVRAYGQNRIHPRGCSTAAFSVLSTSLLTSVTPAWRHWLGDSVRSHGLRASPLSGEKLHTELSSE